MVKVKLGVEDLLPLHFQQPVSSAKIYSLLQFVVQGHGRGRDAALESSENTVHATSSQKDTAKGSSYTSSSSGKGRKKKA